MNPWLESHFPQELGISSCSRGSVSNLSGPTPQRIPSLTFILAFFRGPILTASKELFTRHTGNIYPVPLNDSGAFCAKDSFTNNSWLVSIVIESCPRIGRFCDRKPHFSKYFSRLIPLPRGIVGGMNNRIKVTFRTKQSGAIKMKVVIRKSFNDQEVELSKRSKISSPLTIPPVKCKWTVPLCPELSWMYFFPWINKNICTGVPPQRSTTQSSYSYCLSDPACGIHIGPVRKGFCRQS